MSKSSPAAEPETAVDEMLCFTVYSAGLAFNRIYKPLLDQLELTYPQYLVMVSLWAKDDQTVSGIGDQLFLESSTLTPLLKRLEALGYITRTRDPNDERVVRVRLSAQGSALRKRARHVGDCIGEATGMTMSEVEKLRANLIGLRENLRRASDR